MKRNRKTIGSLLLAFLMIITLVNVPAITAKAAFTENEKRAVWISYLDFQEYLRDKTEARYRQLVTNMCNNAVNNNLNTIIVQVRPMADAIYPSKYYPWSSYVVSGRNDPGYDPLKIFVEVAHQKNLKIEAWINPYRVSHSTAITNSVKGTTFYNTYKSHMIEYGSNGQTCLALNPADQAARDLIVNGVKEIVQNYNVDGIHMDDYFYVSGMADSVPVNTRMSNVNKLVASIYSTVKSIDSTCEFGISPAGNLGNARGAGADVDRWLSENGYVDYLMPQIYWTDTYYSRGKYQTLFTNRAKEWYALKKNNNVKMYVGLALYRVGTNSSTDQGWAKASNNLSNQYKNAYSIGYRGYSLFRYAWFDKPGAKTELANLKNTAPATYVPVTGVNYAVHCQTYGWLTPVANGAGAGTEGQGKRLESINISLKDIDGGIRYRTHVQSYGWLDWAYDGRNNGTTGEGKRLEAIQIELTGNAAQQYDVYYRVHCQSFGWLDWAKNGEIAGTTGMSKRLESIQIVLVAKNGPAPGATTTPYQEPCIAYRTHVQTYGWQGNSYNGLTSGTTGKGKRLEAITLNLVNQKYSGNISYRTHVQTYGWQNWVSNGAVSGTSGKAKRLEAIQIKLDGELAQQYDVYYRVHIQSIGWQEWKKNGETAGTEGQAKRLEAIQIKLVPKDRG